MYDDDPRPKYTFVIITASVVSAITLVILSAYYLLKRRNVVVEPILVAEPIQVFTPTTTRAGMTSRIAAIPFPKKQYVAVAAPLGLIAMYFAQLQLFRSPDHDVDNLYSLLLVALAVVALALLMVPIPTVNIALPALNKIKIRWGWLVVSIVLAVFAGWRAKQDTTVQEQFVVWLLSMGALVLAFVRTSPRVDSLKRWEWLLVLGLLVGALLVRSVNIATEPYMLDGDEARFAEIGSSTISAGWANSPFHTSFDSYSHVQSDLIAFCISVLGTTVTAARIPSVVFGSLTIPAIYLLGRELYNWKLGLAAAIFTLGWALHVQFSRLGLNQAGDTLFGTLVFYFLIRGIRRANAFDYALCGIMLALSQMFYLASLQYPFILIAFLLWMAWRRSDLILPQWRLILIIPVTMFITYLPRLYYLWQAQEALIGHTAPNIFLGRYWSDAVANGEEGVLIYDQVTNSFSGLFSLTDRALWYGPGSNALSPVGGPLLLAGLVTCLLLLKRYPMFALAAGWSFSAVFFGVTLSNYPPEYQRMVAGVPGFALLIGLGVVALSNIFANLFPPRYANYLFHLSWIVVGVASLAFYIGIYVPESRYLYKPSVWAGQHAALDMRDQIRSGRQGYLIDGPGSGLDAGAPVIKYFMANITYEPVPASEPIATALKDISGNPSAVYVAPQRLGELTAYLRDNQMLHASEPREVDFSGSPAYYEILLN